MTMKLLKRLRVAFIGLPYEERPDVPCGNKKEHYEWTDSRMSCPNCMFKRIAAEKLEEAIAEKERKKMEMEQLADMIVTKLITKLKEEKVI